MEDSLARLVSEPQSLPYHRDLCQVDVVSLMGTTVLGNQG